MDPLVSFLNPCFYEGNLSSLFVRYINCAIIVCWVDEHWASWDDVPTGLIVPPAYQLRLTQSLRLKNIQLSKLRSSSYYGVDMLLPVGWFIYKTLGFLTVAVHTSSSNKHYAKQMRELEITTTRGAASHVGEPGLLGQSGQGRSAPKRSLFWSRSQQSAKTSLYFGACVSYNGCCKI